jgi:hypothetical protein
LRDAVDSSARSPATPTWEADRGVRWRTVRNQHGLSEHLSRPGDFWRMDPSARYLCHDDVAGAPPSSEGRPS